MTKKKSMTADDITLALQAKYNGWAWRCFPEFRCETGYKIKGKSIIDFLVVGLYHGQGKDKIISYEIKVSRGDFRKDVDSFTDKHSMACAFSNEFYYICPHSLIDKNEIPDRAGLCYVTAAKTVKVIKQAKFFEISNIPLSVVKSLLDREGGQKVDLGLCKLKYANTELTMAGLTELVRKKAKELRKREKKSLYDKRIESVEDIKTQRDKYKEMLFDLYRQCGIWLGMRKEFDEELIKNKPEVLEQLKLRLEIYGKISHADYNIKKAIEEMEDILKDIKTIGDFNE